MQSPGRIDLHAHTNVSDGTESPSRLVAAGLAAGLSQVAITDHDTTAGWDEAFAAAEGTNLGVVPGIELSTQLDEASVHVLGYFLDPTDADLITITTKLRNDRVDRAMRIVERLAQDVEITWEDVVAQTPPGATVGRPHIADALVARRIVADQSEAFKEMLNRRSSYYVPHSQAPLPVEGVKLIVAAGGVAIIAHPAAAGNAMLFDDAQFRTLVQAGLGGLELHHRDNEMDLLPKWVAWATDYDLIVTGSSDWHGSRKSNLLGEHYTDPAQFARIVELATR